MEQKLTMRNDKKIFRQEKKKNSENVRRRKTIVDVGSINKPVRNSSEITREKTGETEFTFFFQLTFLKKND